MSVTLIPSQLSSPDGAPVPYTGNTWMLCWADLLLFFKCAWSIPGILHPWDQWLCGDLDELYPFSFLNVVALVLHGFLILWEALFLVSLPLLVVLPIWTALAYVAVVMAVVWVVCLILNGTQDVLESRVNLGADAKKHPEECWIYLNGVSIG